MHTSHTIAFLTLVLLLSGTAPLAAADDEKSPSYPGLFSVADYGAVGDGKSKDTAAIQKAIDAANHAGGGTVYFPPGTYLSGTIYLKNRVTLNIDFAATLLGSTDVEDYPIQQCDFLSATDRYCARALIWGENLHDIAITGRGTIDGQGSYFKDNIPSEEKWNKLFEDWNDETRYHPKRVFSNRPYIIRFISCKNILIEGIKLQNSAMWMQHYLNCDFVTVRGVTVYNHAIRNNDMIDIDCCRNVIISDCVGDTDDDGITLKSTANHPTENVTITNCLLSSHCNAIKAGTESNGGFKNITITNCVIRPSADQEPFLGWPEGLAGIALEIVDGGVMDRVTISNITMTGKLTPIFLRLGNRARPFKPDAPQPAVGVLRNVIISNIIATNAAVIGCSITGLPGHPLENISISNVKISFVGGGTKQHAEASVAELPAKYPDSIMFGKLPAYGFYSRHVEGLTFRDVDLSFEQDDHRPALVCDDVENLRVDGLTAQGMPNSQPLIVLDKVRTALIHGCIAPPDVAAFVHLKNKSDRISVFANDLSSIQQPFAFDEITPQASLLEDSNRTQP